MQQESVPAGKRIMISQEGFDEKVVASLFIKRRGF
jgi:hypothetical protein